MEQKTILNNIYNYGDQHQLSMALDYGLEAGNFSHQISEQQLIKFCQSVSAHPWCRENGYTLICEQDSKNRFNLIARNFKKRLLFPVKLLDHTIYFHAKELDFDEIDVEFYRIVQETWQQFLCDNIYEYKSHLNNLVVLSQAQTGV